MDPLSAEILGRFEARREEIADEIADASIAEVPGFAPGRDGRLRAEIRALARRHLEEFLDCARSGGPPSPQALAMARERAVTRAREMVPLAALLHSYLIAQRIISAAIARAAEPDARSRGAALRLTARTFDYNIAVAAAMADAYVEVVQGDLADLEAARRGLVEALLSNATGNWPELNRRAADLGFDPERRHVVTLIATEPATATEPVTDAGPAGPEQRSLAQAIARASGRPERNAFVVRRNHELLALLDADGPHAAMVVLARAADPLRQTNRISLRAGVGTPFTDLAGLTGSYQHARRALRHASAHRPVIVAPGDIRLIDELTLAAGDDTSQLIPTPLRAALAEPATRATLAAFIDANMNITQAAATLSLHPNSLRYRLRRIADRTGRDPHQLTDLLELIAALRLTRPPTNPELSSPDP